MVSGGWILSQAGPLDSTEVFNNGVWRTVAGKLRRRTESPRGAIINNRVLIFGIESYFVETRPSILGSVLRNFKGT